MLSKAELIVIRDRVAFAGRLSDSLFKIGPLSIGLDGLAAWIPGLGEIYSVVVGGFIIVQGARAGVPGSVLTGAVALLGIRTLGTAVPVVGALFADAFTAHKWAAAMIVREINKQLI